MSDEAQGRSGDATLKEKREEIARRNADARKRAQADRKLRAGVVESRMREQARREQDELHALNARLAEQRGRGPG